MERSLFPTAPPAKIGRFELVRQLGRGGMGVVYLAVDPELKREVAIKVHGRGVGEDARRRMRREAESLARLRHPNVVSIYEVGLSESGDVFVVMEYLSGPTLGEWVDAQPRSIASIVRMLVACARALDAAHQVDLVHRDFKPGNVVLDHDEEPKIIDFGLARTGDEYERVSTVEDAPTETITVDGALAGTPRYMAPELLRGEPPSARSDQFALCVSLYELIAGEPPYEKKKFGVAPRRPSKLGARVWRVVQRGLGVDPSARFESLDALARALEAAIAPRTRQRMMLAGGTLVVAAVAGVLATQGPAPIDPCTIGEDFLDGSRGWDGPAQFSRDGNALRMTKAAGPQAFDHVVLDQRVSLRDRALEFELLDAPDDEKIRELMVSYENETGAPMAAVLIIGNRWVFPVGAGMRELGMEISPGARFFRMQIDSRDGLGDAIAFEMSADRETWEPIARTYGHTGPGRLRITIGSTQDMATPDTGEIRGLVCRPTHEIGELPYDRDLAAPRKTEEERAAADL